MKQRPYYGPRRLTAKETAAYLALPSSEIRKARDALMRQNTEVAFSAARQLTTLMHKRAQYERTVPANNGRAAIDG